jgi:hypothetical protein
MITTDQLNALLERKYALRRYL